MNFVAVVADHFCLALPTPYSIHITWSPPFCQAGVANLVVSDDGVELAEGGEAEEGVDDVGRQVDRGLPLFPEIGEDI